MCPSPSRNRRRASVLPLAARRKETKRMGQAGATDGVAMAAWQAGRDHRAPVLHRPMGRAALGQPAERLHSSRQPPP
jgi:hypothetical protein